MMNTMFWKIFDFSDRMYDNYIFRNQIINFDNYY